MSVLKGFKDEAGNMILVQGAGTVYNEDKNSLALGNDTVAIGQDQLVFGRHNETDAAKAEIVGGGTVTEGEQTFTTTEAISNALNAALIGKRCTVIAPRLANSLSITKIGNTRQEVVEYLRLAGYTIDGIVFSGLTSDIDTYYVSNTSSGSVIERLYLVDVNGTLIMPERNYSWANRICTISGISSMGVISSATLDVEIVNRKNIRTLDWEGTQWNAGDVTCDDGNGNTISLRGLSNGKANTEHTHTIEDVTGLQTALDGKANTSHYHNDIASTVGGAYSRVTAVGDEITIAIGNSDGEEPIDKEVDITVENFDNLTRALQTPDSTPTEASDKLIKSGAVYTALAGKVNTPVNAVEVPFDVDNGALAVTSDATDYDSIFANAPVSGAPANWLPVMVGVFSVSDDMYIKFLGTASVENIYDSSVLEKIAVNIYVGAYTIHLEKNVSTSALTVSMDSIAALLS